LKWKTPPTPKVYEAIGVLGDGRITIDGNTAKVYSSTRSKYYDVTYSPEKNAINSNDNSSYYIGYCGYPAIAFLMAKGILKYNKEYEKAFAGIKWKDLNQKYKNDFERAAEEILADLKTKGFDTAKIEKDAKEIVKQIKALALEKLETGQKPPVGY